MKKIANYKNKTNHFDKEKSDVCHLANKEKAFTCSSQGLFSYRWHPNVSIVNFVNIESWQDAWRDT